jgi:hypothetical protein
MIIFVIILNRGFKALKNLTLVYYKLGDSKKVQEKFKKFMEYVKGHVTPNYAEKGLNSALDKICSGKDIDLTESVFHIALDALAKSQEVNNRIITFGLISFKRVWFRTNLKLGKFLYDNNEHSKLAKVLKF